MEVTKEDLRLYLQAQFELGQDKELVINSTVVELRQQLLQKSSEPVYAKPVQKEKVEAPPSLSDFISSAPKVVKRNRQRNEDFKECHHLEILHNVIHNHSTFKNESGHKPVLNGKGNHPSPPIMIVGLAPTKDDLQMKTPFSGEQGKLLSGMLEKILGVQKQLCFLTYFYRSEFTQPISNEDRRWLDAALKKEVELVQPKTILFLGSSLSDYLFNDPRPINDFKELVLNYASTPAFITFSIKDLLEQPALRKETLPLLGLLKKNI